MHPSIIPALFSIFTSEKHLKVLIDKENAASIGSSIDELIRHHPSLRKIVFDSLISTLKKIESLGTTYVPPSDIQQYYSLSLVTEQPSAQNEDVDMEDAQPLAPSEGPAASPEDAPTASDDAQAKTHDNVIINYIDAVGRVLLFIYCF